MPIALEPNETASVSLDIDTDKPAESRPTFLFRFLSCRETMLVERLNKEMREAADNEVSNALLNRSLSVGLVGWRNIVDRDGKPVPFTTEPAPAGELPAVRIPALDDILTPLEKVELVYKCTAEMQMAELGKKKARSGSPPASNTDSSAKTAEPAVA